MSAQENEIEQQVEIHSLCDGVSNGVKEHNCESHWYQRKTLVKEVFYVQALLVLVIVVASIVNIARNISDCDKQVWLLMLSSGIAHMLPSPGIGKDFSKLTKSPTGSLSDGRSASKKFNFATVWYKRTSQHREIFYVQALLIFAVVISSIIFLSLDVGEKNILIVLLSASFAHFLPGPSFIQTKEVID